MAEFKLPEFLQIHLGPKLFFPNDFVKRRQLVISNFVMEIFDRSMLDKYDHPVLYYLAKPIHVHPNKTNEKHLKYK